MKKLSSPHENQKIFDKVMRVRYLDRDQTRRYHGKAAAWFSVFGNFKF